MTSQATHFVAYIGDEPVASMRVRWFNDFAKLERSAFRKDYRDIKTVKFAAEFVLAHVAQKDTAASLLTQNNRTRDFGRNYSNSNLLKESTSALCRR